MIKYHKVGNFAYDLNYKMYSNLKANIVLVPIVIEYYKLDS